MESYNKKIVVSGNMIEVYEYENSIYYEKHKRLLKKQKTISKDKNLEYKKMVRRKSLLRAKRDIIRIIYCNVTKNSKFLTLTYKKNITDLDIANDEFKKFMKRLKYKYKMELQYTAVVEFQKRGAIHYHIILYNFDNEINIKEIEDIWRNGFIKLNRIEDDYKDIENIKNYMVKDIMNDDVRLKGRKKYFNSRGLQRPQEVVDPEVVKNLLSVLSDEYFRSKRNVGNEYNELIITKYILP